MCKKAEPLYKKCRAFLLPSKLPEPSQSPGSRISFVQIFAMFHRSDRPSYGLPLTLSIRIGQVGYSFHFRPSRSNAFAMTISLRMTAVMASFLHFPVDTNC
jgi:hypothetical protein